jgi:hypothetical protein
MKQSLSLSEQDIKEFETLEVIPKTIIEGTCGDLLKLKGPIGPFFNVETNLKSRI